MKTALQELIELIVNNKTRLDIIEKNQKIWLEKEKQQIINSFKAGMDYTEYSVPPNFSNEWDEYYKQTYLENKS